jgi:hypothetical protein
MAEKIDRLYSMEDEVMLKRAQVQQANLATDAALFLAKFPWLDAAYITGYLANINTADAFPEDFTVMQDLTVLTDDVNASMTEGKNALKTLFLYAGLTYPDNKTKQRVFGQDKMEKARTDQEKMENLLEHANTMANKEPYKTDLIAKGYTQVQIDGLLTISDNINAKNLLQESAKSSRPVTTQDRVNVFNAVYDRMRTVATCAEVVFFGDAAKITQYRAYPPSAPDATTATVEVHNESDAPVEGLTVNILGTDQVTDVGGMAGLFKLGASPPDNVDIVVTGAINPSPQTFNRPVIEGEANPFEVIVTV